MPRRSNSALRDRRLSLVFAFSEGQPVDGFMGAKTEPEVELFFDALIKKYSKGEMVELLIQPEDLVHDDSSNLKFEVVDKKFRGTDLIYTLKTKSNILLPVFVHSHHEHLHDVSEKFGLKQPIYIDHLVCFN